MQKTKRGLRILLSAIFLFTTIFVAGSSDNKRTLNDLEE